MKKFVTKNKLQIISILIVFICFGNVLAQNNVGIGTTSPDASALLELQSTNSGFLPPRMTTTQRDAIASPATGLYIWNTTIGRYEYNSGTPASPNWVGFLTGSTIPLNNQYIFVGNASNYATGVPLTGDATITNAGVLTIANNAITTTKILNDAVDGTKINLSGNLNGDLMYYNGTDWVRLPVGTINQVLTSTGTIPAWQTSSSTIPLGTLDQTLRNDGAGWVVNSTFKANSSGQITVGNATTIGTILMQDLNGQAITLQSADLSANRAYTFPEVGNNASFVMTEGAQTINGAKTLTENLAMKGSTAKEIRFYDNSTTNYAGFVAPATITTSKTYILPAADGTGGQVLSTNGSGVLSWSNSGGLPTGALDQTLRNDGVSWVVNTTLSANSTGKLTLGDAATNAGSAVFYDGNGGQKLTLQSADLSADRTYTLPDAGANANVVMTEGSQTLNGAKTLTGVTTFTDNVAIKGSTAKELRIYDAAGTEYSAFKAQPQSANVTYTLPAADATSSGQVLTSNASGILSWATPAGGLPSGTDKQTLRYNGTSLTATSNLINDGTNIGIGTSLTTPASLLHIDGGTATSSYLKFTAGTTTGQLVGNGFDVGVDGLGYAQLFQRSNFGMIFYTNNIERMRIFNGTKTNIGINQQTAFDDSYKLYIGNNDGFRGMLYVDSSIVTGAEIKLIDNSGSNNFVAFKAPNTVTASKTYILPATDGTSGQVLSTDGSANLSWAAGLPSGTTSQTLRNNGTSWIANSILTNDGTTITANGNLEINNSDNFARVLKLYEPSGSGTNSTSFKAQAQAGDVTYTLPAADGTNGEILTTNGSATLSWGLSIIKASASLSANVTGITTTAYQTATVTVTGARANATVTVNPRAALTTAVFIAYAYVSANDTVSLVFAATNGTRSQASGTTFDITIIQ